MRSVVRIIVCTIIFCTVLPVMADTTALPVKHGLKHKFAKLTGDTLALPVVCASAPLAMAMISYCYLPYPPNAVSASEYGNTWKYALFVPTFDALVIPTAPAIIGAYQMDQIKKDIGAIVVGQNGPASSKVSR